MSSTNFTAGTVIASDWLNDVDAATYEGAAVFTPAGTGATTRTVQAKLRESVSVLDFGADPTGVADSTVAIQAAIDAVRDGTVLIPGGEYLVNSDLVLLSKGRAPEEGAFRLEATGAFFVGTGRLVVNSCKRVQINGLDMANMDLVFRGVWWSQFSNMRFKRLHINDAAGTGFSSNYWDQFQQCQFQTILTDATSTSASNEFTFESCSMRGNAGQGFSGTAAYAFEFNANQNCQAWKFNNGDISYHTTAIYNVDGGNSSDIELAFDGVYFDSLLPQPTDRDDTRIISVNCHHATGTVYVATLPQFTTGQVDLYRADRHWRHNAAQGVNLIPNGDFKQTLTTWVGSGLPIGSINSATVTVNAGGLSGVYLNVNQALTTSNSVRFRPKALPHAGRATATLVIRNADAGSKTMLISFAGLSPSFSISDSDWSVVRITSGALLASGTTNDLQIYTNDSTAFNVDVAYVGITMGEGAEMIVPSSGFRTIEYSESFDVPSIAAGAQEFNDFTVTGAALGDFALISCGSGLLGLQVTANVNATNTVRMVLQNNTASPIDLGVAVWYIRVWKRLYD